MINICRCGKTLDRKVTKMCWNCYKGKRHQNYKKAWGSLKEIKPVYQYDKKENLLTTWTCLTEVSRLTHMKFGNIRKALSGELKTAYGFIWRHE
jgi:hypothetical protein